MPSVTTIIADQLTRRNVNLLRVEAGLRKKVRALLAKVGDDLIADLARYDPTEPLRAAYQRRRLEQLLAEADTTVNGGISEVSAALTVDMHDLAVREANGVVALLNGVLGVDVVSLGLDLNELKTLATDALIQGAPSAEWWDRQASALARKFADQMRIGMTRGETLQQLVQRVRGTRANGFKDGIMEASKRDAEALVRTSVQTAANAARAEVYKENDDLVKGIEWISTLDNRTTEICIALDGKQWDMNYEPIGHGKSYPGPTAHWGCRSTQIPVLYSWEELATRNKKLAAKLDAAMPDARASMDGQVSGGVDYEDWLKSRPEAEQKEILGTGKWKLWKDGRLSFSQLTDMSNNPLPLNELK